MKRKVIARICVPVVMLFAAALFLGSMAFAEDNAGYVRIDLNAATVKELSALPGVGKKKAEAIVAYRDKLDLSGAGGPNYYNGRQLGMDSTNPVREDPGFASIAESVNVTQNLGLSTAIDPYYDIRRYARDYNPDGTKKDQQGFPDLTPGGSSADGAENDFE